MYHVTLIPVIPPFKVVKDEVGRSLFVSLTCKTPQELVKLVYLGEVPQKNGRVTLSDAADSR